MHPHLRRRSRGCENACYHATEENEFSPVHRAKRPKRLKPLRGFKVAALEKVKGNDRITIVPLQRRAISKAAEDLAIFELVRARRNHIV